MKNGCCGRQNSDAVVAGQRGSPSGELDSTSVVLAAMPKCPLCLAAYVALFTGFGVSLAAANFAWWFVVAGCVSVLVYLAISAARGLTA
ncbi:MAG TPA: hypothetical protein VHU84_09925 [Lacipirellulaceae bacterium]|jgi:hypothetical protein|nr:hypothetical protein [Lacipirellulaceae bacterium]